MKGIQAEAQSTVVYRLTHNVDFDQSNNASTTSLDLEQDNSLGIHFPTPPKREPIPIEMWLSPKAEHPLRTVDPLTALNRRLAFPIFSVPQTCAYHGGDDFFPVKKPFAVAKLRPIFRAMLSI